MEGSRLVSLTILEVVVVDVSPLMPLQALLLEVLLRTVGAKAAKEVQELFIKILQELRVLPLMITTFPATLAQALLKHHYPALARLLLPTRGCFPTTPIQPPKQI